MLPRLSQALGLLTAQCSSPLQGHQISFAAAAHAVCVRLLSQRADAAAATDGEPRWGDRTADIDAAGTYYRTPYHIPSPDDGDIGQRRATGRLEAAIEGALLADTVVREQLVDRLGLAVHRVRLSNDRRTAHILWDANPGAAAACEAALRRCAYRLRRHIAKVLRSRHTPYLEFRHDHLPPHQACVAAAIERVEREHRREDQEQQQQQQYGGAAQQQRWDAEDVGASSGSHAESPPEGGEAATPTASSSASASASSPSEQCSTSPASDPASFDVAIRELEARLPRRKRRYPKALQPYMSDDPGS